MLDSKELERALTFTNPTPCTDEEHKKIKAKKRINKKYNTELCQNEIDEIVNKIKNDNQFYGIKDFPVELSFTTDELRANHLTINNDFFIAIIKKHIYIYPKEFKELFLRKAENISLINHYKNLIQDYIKMFKTTTAFHILFLTLSFFVAKIVPNKDIILILLVGILIFYVLFLVALRFFPSLDIEVDDSFNVLLYPLPFGSYFFGILNISEAVKKYKYYKKEPEILIKAPKRLEQITTVYDLTKKGKRIILCR